MLTTQEQASLPDLARCPRANCLSSCFWPPVSSLTEEEFQALKARKGRTECCAQASIPKENLVVFEDKNT